MNFQAGCVAALKDTKFWNDELISDELIVNLARAVSLEECWLMCCWWQ